MGSLTMGRGRSCLTDGTLSSHLSSSQMSSSKDMSVKSAKEFGSYKSTLRDRANTDDSSCSLVRPSSQKVTRLDLQDSGKRLPLSGLSLRRSSPPSRRVRGDGRPHRSPFLTQLMTLVEAEDEEGMKELSARYLQNRYRGTATRGRLLRATQAAAFIARTARTAAARRGQPWATIGDTSSLTTPAKLLSNVPPSASTLPTRPDSTVSAPSGATVERPAGGGGGEGRHRRLSWRWPGSPRRGHRPGSPHTPAVTESAPAPDSALAPGSAVATRVAQTSNPPVYPDTQLP